MLTADGLLEGQTADTDAERRCHDFPHRQEINRFVAACEALLAPEITPKDLSEREGNAIQYYLSAMSTKFPALLS